MKIQKLLLVLPVLLSCNNASGEKEQEIPEHYYSEVQDKVINWTDSLSKEGDYYVYCFSKTCKYCDEIKNEVIDVALKKKRIYFCNENIVTADLDPSTTKGVSDINLLFVRGFPSIITISNNIVKDNVVGKSNVLKIIRS